ncbi:MAG: ABC transporter permease subunit [Firmicutes bacterium]|nr:ABC transporter permease subunit [Bacillota bacterium]
MKKIKKYTGFEAVAIIITFAVTVFIFSAMAFIVMRGVPYIGEAFRSEEVRFALGLSLRTSLTSTLICMLTGIPAAYALVKTRFAARHLFSVIIELPLSIPNIMLGLSLLLMFSSGIGRALSEHGFRVIFNVNGIIMAHILVNLPFVIRMIKTAFMNVDPKVEIVAGSLGAGRLRTFFLITLPLAKNAVIGAAILAWSRALGEFGATLMLVGATRMKTETLPTSIYLNMATGDTGPAMACAMILLAISGISLMLANFINGEHKKAGRN